jgi:hypothetical protein
MPILRKAVLGTLLVTGLAACGGTATAGPVRLECQFDGAGDEAAMCEAFRQQLAASLQTQVATAASDAVGSKDGAWVSARFRVLPQGVIKGSVSYARGGQTGAIADMNMAVSDRPIGPADAAAIAKQVAARIK